MSHQIQSILFKKQYWNPNDAINWLSVNGFKNNKIDEAKNFYRFRQFNPIPGARYINQKGRDRFGNKYPSIEFVISY